MDDFLQFQEQQIIYQHLDDDKVDLDIAELEQSIRVPRANYRQAELLVEPREEDCGCGKDETLTED